MTWLMHLPVFWPERKMDSLTLMIAGAGAGAALIVLPIALYHLMVVLFNVGRLLLIKILEKPTSLSSLHDDHFARYQPPHQWYRLYDAGTGKVEYFCVPQYYDDTPIYDPAPEINPADRESFRRWNEWMFRNQGEIQRIKSRDHVSYLPPLF